jgi:hypothetical protein
MKLLSILTVGFALTSAAFAADGGDYNQDSPVRSGAAPVAPGAPVAPRTKSRTNFNNSDEVFGSTRRSLAGSFDNAANESRAGGAGGPAGGEPDNRSR